jgi:hypothetical protein
MSQQFGFIGWNTEGTSDKVWGYFIRPTPQRLSPGHYAPAHWNQNCCVFWAGRGKAMQFKADLTGSDLDKLAASKRKKGYLEINETKLQAIWPTFIQEAESKLMWDVLAGKIK